MNFSPRPTWTSSSYRAKECAPTRIRSQGTDSLSALSTETSRRRRGCTINLNLRVESSGHGSLGHGDVEIGGAVVVEQRDNPGRHGKLERNVERVAEANLEPRAEAERESVGGRRDGADPPREVRAEERRDGSDGRPQISRRGLADGELDRA